MVWKCIQRDVHLGGYTVPNADALARLQTKEIKAAGVDAMRGKIVGAIAFERLSRGEGG